MKSGHRFLMGALVMAGLVAALALLSGWGQCALAEGSIIYVDADAGGSNNGTSWTDAFLDLQSALDAAVIGSGAQIWVAEGIYKPTQLFEGDLRSAAFQMKNGVAIYGGFAGTETDPGQRDWVNNTTILSGDIGTEGVNSDNSYHVFYHPSGTGLDSSAILDGFTITGGNADGSGDHENGGGMYNYNSAPTLTNCIFSGNSASNRCGGMCNEQYSSPTLTNCTFEGNSAGYGGGMYNYYYSSPTLANCTFSGNSAHDNGGGMNNMMYSSPTLTNCTFQGNYAIGGLGDGGGMFNMMSSSPTLTNCTFSSNSAEESGGAMYNSTSSPTLTDCTFEGNSSDFFGGGMVNSSSSPTLINCTFEGNSAGAGAGGGMVNWYSSPILNDCTFSSNSAPDGGGMRNNGSSPMLTNCTFSDNSADMHGGGVVNSSSSPTFTNCTFEGNSAGNEGGGMYNSSSSSPALTNCTFLANSAGYGGGMYNSSFSSPELNNCTFKYNVAQGAGGGMYNSNSPSTRLTGCAFTDNTAGSSGGGLFNWSSSPVLTNCTFSGNLASVGGGMRNYYNSTPILTNSILWGDTPNEIENDSNSAPVVTYSGVQGGYEGEGNIDADPLFVDAGNGDFHLAPNSPCIDAGNSAAPYLPEVDFEGDERILDGDGDGTAIVDMGVDEVVYAGPPVVEVEIDIRPDSEQNVINLGSGGVVPVAILTTGAFDATTVRPASVLFAEAAPRRWTKEDVDRDGDLDLLLFFQIQKLALDANSTEATLKGETFPHAGGVLIQGTDTVRIIP